LFCSGCTWVGLPAWRYLPGQVGLPGPAVSQVPLCRWSWSFWVGAGASRAGGFFSAFPPSPAAAALVLPGGTWPPADALPNSARVAGNGTRADSPGAGRTYPSFSVGAAGAFPAPSSCVWIPVLGLVGASRPSQVRGSQRPSWTRALQTAFKQPQTLQRDADSAHRAVNADASNAWTRRTRTALAGRTLVWTWF